MFMITSNDHEKCLNRMTTITITTITTLRSLKSFNNETKKKVICNGFKSFKSWIKYIQKFLHVNTDKIIKFKNSFH